MVFTVVKCQLHKDKGLSLVYLRKGKINNI